ncbi:integrin alpha-9-like protein [Willisornis vidua]|uniref:Integrin alpha-9-like protein n=1 Tax=Willisornis vidua TaxID=1566151 RepID=A0ABQ9DEC4_9PASS|nr:integrin alpha-9-like protein [Willisornis vidua]
MNDRWNKEKSLIVAKMNGKKGVRIFERNSYADTKDSEEGGAEGDPGTRAEVPLQPMMKNMKRIEDVISPIVFEAAYSLGEHVIERGRGDKELPALKPILRWKKGQKIAQRNQTVFERNCQSDDCAADLKLQGKLLLSGVDDRTAYLALGAVRNISLNIFISNIGDDAYDTNVFFNFSQELFFIKMWQKEELGIACELLESDFLKCSVGFPFMRSKSKYEFSVIFDTSHLSGQEETLTFLVTAQSGNLERTESLHDNTLTLSVPLMHEVTTSISGEVFPTSFFYGDSVDASNLVQLENQECLFQSLNFTLQVYNAGPSTLPGAFLDISFPNRLSATGDEIFHIQEMMDCERPGRSCLIIHCNLSSLPKSESCDISIYMLLNTEILKKDSSSVIQFVTRARLRVDHDLRVVEVPSGSQEEKPMKDKKLIRSSQHEFTKGKSCLVILIAFYNETTTWMDEEREWVLSALTSARLLTLVSHSTLIGKLSKCGLGVVQLASVELLAYVVNKAGSSGVNPWYIFAMVEDKKPNVTVYENTRGFCEIAKCQNQASANCTERDPGDTFG